MRSASACRRPRRSCAQRSALGELRRRRRWQARLPDVVQLQAVPGQVSAQPARAALAKISMHQPASRRSCPSCRHASRWPSEQVAGAVSTNRRDQLGVKRATRPSGSTPAQGRAPLADLRHAEPHWVREGGLSRYTSMGSTSLTPPIRRRCTRSTMNPGRRPPAESQASEERRDHHQLVDAAR